MHKSVHELWGGKLTIFELPSGPARDENSRDRGRAEAVFLDSAGEKVSSKRGGLRWGSRSWGAEDEGGALPGARGRFLCAPGEGECARRS